ncbi:hypothetical protein LY76DRAFT_51427 [Colletotrichum caudatum]|nr:hypothetical protein LY76DRAFT_51427 [Colletotrichum caudatum]
MSRPRPSGRFSPWLSSLHTEIPRFHLTVIRWGRRKGNKPALLSRRWRDPLPSSPSLPCVCHGPEGKMLEDFDQVTPAPGNGTISNLAYPRQGPVRDLEGGGDLEGKGRTNVVFSTGSRVFITFLNGAHPPQWLSPKQSCNAATTQRGADSMFFFSFFPMSRFLSCRTKCGSVRFERNKLVTKYLRCSVGIHYKREGKKKEKKSWKAHMHICKPVCKAQLRSVPAPPPRRRVCGEEKKARAKNLVRK